MQWLSKHHKYPHDWETVTAAFWVKYPNVLQPHVISVDTLKREIDEQNKKFRVLRLVSLQYSIPQWAANLLHIRTDGYAIEECICDYEEKSLCIHTHNTTLSNLFRVHEYCRYAQDPQNENHTLYEQRATYSAPGLGFIQKAVESAAVRSALERASVGLSVMQDKILSLERTNWKDMSYSLISDKYILLLEPYTAALVEVISELQNELQKPIDITKSINFENISNCSKHAIAQISRNINKHKHEIVTIFDQIQKLSRFELEHTNSASPREPGSANLTPDTREAVGCSDSVLEEDTCPNIKIGNLLIRYEDVISQYKKLVSSFSTSLRKSHDVEALLTRYNRIKNDIFRRFLEPHINSKSNDDIFYKQPSSATSIHETAVCLNPIANLCGVNFIKGARKKLMEYIFPLHTSLESPLSLVPKSCRENG